MRLFGYNITIGRASKNQTESQKAPEQRRDANLRDFVADGRFSIFSNISSSGIPVSIQRALSVPGVWSAVKTISETLATLPIDLYRKTPDGAKVADTHRLYDLIKYNPHPMYSAYEFRRTLVLHACFGDGFALIHRGVDGFPKMLEIMPIGSVDPYTSTEGKFYYIVRQNGSAPRVVMPGDMIHLKGLSLDGLSGMPVIDVHRETLGMAIAANEYGATFFGNGAHLGGYIKFPGTLKAEQRENLLKKVIGSGMSNVGKTMVLDAGMEYEKIGITPEEAALNEARNFQVSESARIFGIPAHLLQQLDRATFNNIETMNVQFVKLCLNPWAEQMEQELVRKLLIERERLGGRYFLRINLDGLLRGDTEARAQYYETMYRIRALSPNEIRQQENLNPYPGGDQYYTEPGSALPDNQTDTDASDEQGNQTAE